MFIAHVLKTDNETKAETRSVKRFTDHKSARSYARRNIVKGAHFVGILERKSDDESNEVLKDDKARNVYRAKVDNEGVRSHVLIPLDDFEAFAKKAIKTKRA